MTLKDPIKHDSLQKTVYGAIRAAILNGELAPGEQIFLGDLAKRLHVSTMPVREALRTLEAQGMISFSSQKKILVARLSAEDLEEFYWIRIPLECRSFVRNLAYLGNEEMEELHALHRMMSDENTSGPEWVRLNREFHMLLYGTKRSRVLKGALKWLWDNVTAYLNLYAQKAFLVQEANRAHEALLSAIEEKEMERAVEILKTHLESGLELKEILHTAWRGEGEEAVT